MALGNGILITPEPKGNFFEGIISGTPKPGIVVDIKSVDADGNITFEPAGTTAANSTYSGMAADGERTPIFVLLCSQESAACPPGRPADVAYVDGERCSVYMPIPGDRFNMIVQDTSGTAADQDFVRGLSRLMVDDGTGKLAMSAGSIEAEPFRAMETKADLAADYLMHVMYTGN